VSASAAIDIAGDKKSFSRNVSLAGATSCYGAMKLVGRMPVFGKFARYGNTGQKFGRIMRQKAAPSKQYLALGQEYAKKPTVGWQG
jgi:hypothetical protein